MDKQIAQVIEQLEKQYGSVTARLIQIVVREKLNITITLQQALQAYVSYRYRDTHE